MTATFPSAENFGALKSALTLVDWLRRPSELKEYDRGAVMLAA